jgi:hypothetical protein
MPSERVNPYTALQREVAQFISNIWLRPKTALFTFDVSDWARGQMDAADKLGYSLAITRNGNTITVHAVKKVSVGDVPYQVRPGHIEGSL